MPVLSYIHHLFDIAQCQAYIHTLRWKDRSLQCPRCQSQDVDPWGQYHYRPGCKRYWCNGCQRTFNLTFRTPSDSDPRIFPAACCARIANPNRDMLSSHARRYIIHLCLRSVVWDSCYHPSKPTKSNICPL